MPSLHGTTEPRFGTKRSDLPTRGRLDANVAQLLGWSFFPWQDRAADVAGEYDPDTGLPKFRTVGIALGRQGGKTTLICARIARQLIGNRQTVAYTAQDRGIATTKWAEHVGLLMSTPFADRVERIDRANHREMLVMTNGSRYMPVTPSTKKGARSLSIDLAVIDEAHAHDSMGVVGALAGTLVARPHAQLWLLSNAGDSSSVLWRHYTEVGRHEVGNPNSTTCWLEWCPDPAHEVDVWDRQAWADANPSLGLPGGVIEAALADAALNLDAATFSREHLNVWVDATEMTGIDAVAWAACRIDDLAAESGIAVGLDFTSDRSSGAVVTCGMTASGITPIEVVEAGTDLEYLIRRAAEIAVSWQGMVMIDRGSPAASAIPALTRMTSYGSGHRVRLVSLPDLVKATGEFHDAAMNARLSHRGDYRLTDAVAAAGKRRLGDAWTWSRKGKNDISPLIAATLARWGVVSAPAPLIPSIY